MLPQRLSSVPHPHMVVQFHGHGALDNAIALLGAGRHHPPQLGLLPLEVSPFPMWVWVVGVCVGCGMPSGWGSIGCLECTSEQCERAGLMALPTVVCVLRGGAEAVWVPLALGGWACVTHLRASLLCTVLQMATRAHLSAILPIPSESHARHSLAGDVTPEYLLGHMHLDAHGRAAGVRRLPVGRPPAHAAIAHVY